MKFEVCKTLFVVKAHAIHICWPAVFRCCSANTQHIQ